MVTTIGLDIAKSVFQVHGVDAAGQVRIRRQLKRRAVLKAFFQKLPVCLVGIVRRCALARTTESRELQALGHSGAVRCRNGSTLKPYVKRQKNDMAGKHFRGVGGYQNSAPAASAGPARGSRSLMTAGPAVNAPRSVSHFTFERRKICDPYLAQMGDENASHRMDRPRRPGRAWPALVGCCDVQIGPHAQRGNQLGLDAVKQPQGSRTKLTGPLLIK